MLTTRLLILSLIVALSLTGCPAKDGPMEEAGEKVDKAIEDTGDAIEDATD